MNYKIPRGTFDILPADSYKWQYVQRVFREVAAAFGYREITTPIFEMAELFERSSGESSDVVQKEMYRFNDQRGRTFALRPEGTAPVVRSYVENHLEMQGSRSKLYYIGPMFRYDRPQAGRYRQFYQYGVEFIGSNHPYYDAEVIALEMTFLKTLGIKNARLEINSVGCGDCSKDYDAALRAFFEPHIADLCPDCQRRYELKPRRLLDCKVPSCKALRAGAPSQFDFLDAKCKEHFDAVCQYLDSMGIAYTINPAIVRGLDYYTGMVFEGFAQNLGAENQILGGGTYRLAHLFGGDDVASCGFAIGFDRVMVSLGDIQPATVPVVGLVCTTEGRTRALVVAKALRDAGIRTEMDLMGRGLGAQLAHAVKTANFAIVIGQREVESGHVTLKNLTTAEQKTVDLAAAIAEVRAFGPR